MSFWTAGGMRDGKIRRPGNVIMKGFLMGAWNCLPGRIG
jgi:hypothetical protein